IDDLGDVVHRHGDVHCRGALDVGLEFQPDLIGSQVGDVDHTVEVALHNLAIPGGVEDPSPPAEGRLLLDRGVPEQVDRVGADRPRGGIDRVGGLGTGALCRAADVDDDREFDDAGRVRLGAAHQVGEGVPAAAVDEVAAAG